MTDSHALTGIGLRPRSRPMLFILSGPSGVGKDAVLSRMKRSGFPLRYITTMTTRPPRPNERNDVDYHFVSVDKFRELLGENGLLEHAEVYGNWYGVPREPVRQAFKDGWDVMLKVDIQGVANIKKIIPEAVTIFLMPSSADELVSRLKRRHTESSFDIERRLGIAGAEMEKVRDFDYVVMNREGEIDRAVADIEAIVSAEKCRVNPRKIII